MKFSRAHIVNELISKKVTIAPLVTFRILFGVLMLASIVRFWYNGWIKSQYIDPLFYFPFVDGLAPISGDGMYWVFALMGLASLLMAIGLFYRLSAITFFLLFTYVELIDKTNYLNHYYFISLISFLLIWLPVHRHFSLDIWRKAVRPLNEVPVIFINVLKFQLGIVYFFAGIAKINYDWLINAQPLKMWLSSLVHHPFIGWIFRYKITAYIFSWFGMLFDLSIPFLLSIRKIMPYAYLMVVAFHLLTAFLFPIGMFPFIMIFATTLFFPCAFHEKVLGKMKNPFKYAYTQNTVTRPLSKVGLTLFVVFFMIQILIPLRYLANPGNVFWNELGYRFSWRVMLMEKAGHITFYVEEENRRNIIANYDYLTPQQEKMMATQPDMILQFARFLEDDLKSKGFNHPKISAQSYVTLNGRPGRPFIKPDVDLTKVSRSQIPTIVFAYE